MAKKLTCIALAMALLLCGCVKNANAPPIEDVPPDHRPTDEQVAEMESAARLVAAFDWPENTWENMAAMEPLVAGLSAAGISVDYDWVGATHVENVAALVAAAEREQSASVTLVQIGHSAESSWPRAYYTEGGAVYTCTLSIEGDEAVLSEPEQVPAEKLVITDYGYFLGVGRPLRVVPLPEGCAEALYTYVLPVGNYLTLRDSWATDNFKSGFPGLLFEALCFYTDASYISWDSPYLSDKPGEEWVFYFPADVYEGLVLRYFDIPVERLRSGRNYLPDRQVYRLEAWQGGGAYPSLEVWEIAENPDGTLAIGVAFISGITDEPDGYLNSVLTVHPLPEGGFRYISNKVVHIPPLG